MKYRVDYTREELIALCEKAIVHEKEWSNRDTCSAQQNVGECWAYLKAGCSFKVNDESDICCTDENTIWITFFVKDFADFEHVGSTVTPKLCYLPQPECLYKTGLDWY